LSRYATKLNYSVNFLIHPIVLKKGLPDEQMDRTVPLLVYIVCLSGKDAYSHVEIDQVGQRPHPYN
jgi:hypothetical protein